MLPLPSHARIANPTKKRTEPEKSPARLHHLNPGCADPRSSNAAGLLHRPGFAVFEALVDDRLDLYVRIACHASLLGSEPALSLAQSALLLSQPALLPAQFPLPISYLSLQLTE